MNLKTSLRLGALFPIVLTAVVCLGFVLILLKGTDHEAEIPLLRVTFSIMALLMTGLLYKVGSDLISRIQTLEAAAQGAREGRFEKVQGPQTTDEISAISAGFNEMVSSLEKFASLTKDHESLKTELGTARKDLERLRAGEMDVSDGLERLSRAQNLLVEHQRMNLLAHMFSGISHDLNGALTSILARAEFALDISKARLSAQTREDYKAIKSAAQKLKAEFDGLASYYRTPADETATIDLTALLDEVISMSEPKWKNDAESRGATIRITKAYEALPKVQGKRPDLIQMFMAILFNAAEAMPRGGEITVAANDNGSGAITIAISDTGIGMNEEVKRRCRRPFFTTKDGSAGVGLPVASGIVRQHGGKMGLVSEEGQGTVIYIDLPIAGEAYEEAMSGEPPNVPAQHLRILFVEDDPWTLEILTKGIQEGGHTVTKCAGPLQALESFKSGEFDVVITDRAMPDMNGEALADAIRKLNKEIPIILLTGFGDVIKITGSAFRSVDLVIAKPVSIAELHNGLADVMALQAHRTATGRA